METKVNYIRQSMLAFPLFMSVSLVDYYLSMKDKYQTLYVIFTLGMN